MNKHILLPLCAMLIASSAGARQAYGGTINVSTTTLSFNGSSGNTSSQPLTITASGRSSVTIQKVSFSNASFSGSSSSLPVTLSRGQSLTLTVTAHPASGAQNGTLTITSTANDPTVSLTETATQATTSHKVALTWNKPTTGYNVVAYDVDRAPAGGTSFSQVGSTGGGTRNWTDTSVQSGQTYVYRVRSVGDEGDTSAPSNTVTLSIP